MVMCYEELTAGLMVQAAVSPGVSTILTNMITAASSSSTSSSTLLTPFSYPLYTRLSQVYIAGSRMTLCVSQEPSTKEENFVDEAINCYLNDRSILLGYFNTEESVKYHLCPPSIPASCHRIYLSDNSKKEKTTTETRKYSNKQVQEFMTLSSNQNIAILKDSESRLLELLIGNGTDLSLVSDPKAASVAIHFEPLLNQPARRLYNYYNAKRLVNKNR